MHKKKIIIHPVLQIRVFKMSTFLIDFLFDNLVIVSISPCVIIFLSIDQRASRDTGEVICAFGGLAKSFDRPNMFYRYIFA